MVREYRKAKVFVGCSVDGSSCGFAIQENLEPDDAEVTVDRHGVFDLDGDGIEGLVAAVRSFDFGVYVFTHRDLETIGDPQHSDVRDNVIAGLGLFIGGLGRERTFVIAPFGAEFPLPPGLIPLRNIARYDPNRKDAAPAFGAACHRIREAIQDPGGFKSGSPRRDGVRDPNLTEIQSSLSFPGIKTGDIPQEPVELVGDYPYDVFVSHASEDKKAIARPLSEELRRRGLRVWYDEFSLTVGDSLRRSIDHGLSRSRFGVVILSRHFFKKHWTDRELGGLFSREVNGVKVILPVWHDVDSSDVRNFSPMLADLMGVSTSIGLHHVVDELMAAMKKAKTAAKEPMATTSEAKATAKMPKATLKKPKAIPKKSTAPTGMPKR